MFSKFLKKFNKKNHSQEFNLFVENKKLIKKVEKPINKVYDEIYFLKQKISNLENEIIKTNLVSKYKHEIKVTNEEISKLTKQLASEINKKQKNILKFKINNLKKNLFKNKSLISFYENVKISELKREIKNFQIKISLLEERLKPLNEKLKPLLKEHKDFHSKGVSSKKQHSFVVKNLNVFYGEKQALKDINISLPKKSVIAIIGPSGCGKSTFLKTLNRINDEVTSFKANGEILLDGTYDIFSLKNINNENEKLTLTELRTRVGMIFQQPNPFPMSIWKNVTYGPRINGIKNTGYLNSMVEKSLKKAALWDEVSENLNISGTALSGGQQQRLCIARAIANNPQILLMDEPTSALDPIASAKIEELILQLKKDYTIIMVTHSMQQAARLSDYTAFFYQGELIEFGKTNQLFTSPKEKRTDDYLRGRFG